MKGISVKDFPLLLQQAHGERYEARSRMTISRSAAVMMPACVAEHNLRFPIDACAAIQVKKRVQKVKKRRAKAAKVRWSAHPE